VQFFYNGTPYPSTISPDGTYAVADIPVGELIVVVETESVNPGRKGPTETQDYKRRMAAVQPSPNGPSGGAADLSKYVKIPEKYAKEKTTPITYTVKAGRQVYNIELE
jgi:hypothetical protein